jgi:hypothetical protein
MMRSRAVVYTAIFGDYDALKQPAPQDDPCDFICFTDNRMPPRVGVWRVVHIKRASGTHPRMQAKRFKLLSHEVFPNGRLAWRFAPLWRRPRIDLSIWVDASLRIKNPTFVADMRELVADGDWAMFAHQWRDCIYDEADASLILEKYRGLPIAQQVESYKSIVPPHGGLYACGVIVRREPAGQRMADVNARWWRENLRWTYQDQLSLPYVLRTGETCQPRIIPGDILSNRWLDFIPHNSRA